MSTSAIISGAVSLGVEALKFVNNKKANKYIDKLYKLKMELLEEEGKDYDADDAKIENIHDQIRITMDAANLVIIRNSQLKQ